MDTSAAFSVLISVYEKNTPDQLSMAIDSIWTTQILKPSQIVLVEDGKLPQTLRCVIDSWKKRLPLVFTIHQLPQNLGLGAALNEGLSCCRYNLVARMDSDDISLPLRFMIQYNHMLNHPDIDVLGTQVEEWDDDLQQKLYSKRLPLTHNELKTFIKYRCPFNHPSVMFKKDVVQKVGGYPCSKMEDYYLWIKLFQKGYRFSNLDATLVRMRAGDMIKNRRGVSVLLPELELQKYLYKCNINTFLEFIYNCFTRVILRTSPSFLRTLLYKYFR